MFRDSHKLDNGHRTFLYAVKRDYLFEYGNWHIFNSILCSMLVWCNICKVFSATNKKRKSVQDTTRTD